MKKRILNIFSRTTLISLEIVAVIFGLAFLTVGILAWRLTSGPVDLAFAKKYIEQALYDPVSGYSVSLEQVGVQWPDLKKPITLQLAGVDLIKNNAIVLEVEDITLGLAARYLFIGAIEPVSISLTAPSLNLIRTEQNEIKLSLEDDSLAPEAGSEEQTTEQDPFARIIAMLSEPEGATDKRSPLDHLKSIEIVDAKMVVADYLLGITWFFSPLDLSFAKDKKGLMITASAELPGGRDHVARIQGDLVYARESEDFFANIHVQDFDPHILSRKIEALDWLNKHYAIINGNIKLGFDKNFHIYKAGVSLSSVNGEVMLDGVYDAPLPFDSLFLDAAYDERMGQASLRDLSVRTKEVTMSLSSEIKIDGDVISAPVKIKIPDLPQNKISPLWPDPLRGDGAEIWLTQKLSEGRIYDLNAGFDVKAEKKEELWSIDVSNIIGRFLFENMDIDYRAPLAPIRQSKGAGNLENDTLTVTLHEGVINDLKVKPDSKAVIDKVVEGGGNAHISVGLNGPLQTVLRYIQPEPIGVSEEELGLNIKDVKGVADLNVNVSFPTVKNLLAKQVIVKAKGTLDDVSLPDVVKNLDLTGGPFALKIEDGAAALSGKGKLEGRTIDFSWKEYVSPEGKEFASQVKAKMIVDKGLRDGLGIGLDDWLEGSFPTEVTYTEYGSGRATADVIADLGPGIVKISPFDHVKSVGTPGTALCKVTFANGHVQEVQNLDVSAAPLQIKNARFIFGSEGGETILRRGALPSFALNENRLNLDLEAPRQGLLKLSVSGPFFDARPFLKDKKGTESYDGPHLVASLTVDYMRTADERKVSQAKAYLDMDDQGDIEQFEMDAVAGKGDIYLRLKRNEQGLMTIRLEADDAGETLRAFNIYENIKSGKLILYGEAHKKSNPKSLHGHVELTDFHVVKAPVLAQLVNAISLLGIQQLLGGEGIYFSRLESEFDWLIRKTGDKYAIKEGRTSGSSLGLTFEGDINKETGLINMNGTIVPVSMVNELVSNIPLIGDILTGGGGGIIAATYKVEGPVKKPEVTVNPLSALAPGILRTILFEGDGN